MDFLLPEEFNNLKANEKKFAYKALYESWVNKGKKIRRFKNSTSAFKES